MEEQRHRGQECHHPTLRARGRTGLNCLLPRGLQSCGSKGEPMAGEAGGRREQRVGVVDDGTRRAPEEGWNRFKEGVPLGKGKYRAGDGGQCGEMS